MKKITLILVGFLCGLALTLNAQTMTKITAKIYSDALDKEIWVNVYLPLEYFYYPENNYYPVIYYLHGWTGNHNNVTEITQLAGTMIEAGMIDPVIIVSANNWVEPFEGSCYLNSILWGNYEDFNIYDVINWVDATFRTIPERRGRAIFGQSMGGYGAFRYTLKHKDKFCAFAANGPTLNFQLLVDNIHAKLLTENSGPPYSYSYQGGGPYTRWMFLLSGAATPNLNTPQTYINPAIVEYPFDEYCEPIDTIWQKLHTYDVLELLHNTTPEDSVGILYCCGTNDEWQLYEANAALADTMDALGLPYEFYSHTGGHGMPNEFKQRAFYFLDSLLLPPAQNWVGIDEPAQHSSAFNLTIFPNPASHNTTCFFELTHACPVNIALLNHLGQELTIVYDGWMWPGRKQIEMNTAALPVGVYFCRVQAGNEIMTRKILKQ